MAAIENHILTITEPTIKLDQVKFASLGEGEGNEKANTSKGYILMVSINGYTFSDWEILSMELDCTGTVPTIDLSIIDTEGVFGVDSFPRDGDVINFRMGTLDKDQYKDIRIDFDISNADAPPQRAEGRGNKYHFSGRIKVPGLYSEDCKSYGVGTSLDHIESIANDLKLGVATNIDAADDSMNLVIPYNSMFDTLEDLVRHSYIDEDSFQTYCIDPYYYVNYVNLNKLMDSEEKIEKMIAAFEKDLADTPQAPAEGVNKAQRALILTNHKRDQGSNLFIVKQSLKNKAGAAAKKNGYKRVLQYFENDSDEGLVSHDIEPLASKNMKDIEEPMKGRRDEDRYKNEIKYKYVGRKCGDPETSNTHLNYEYSAINNAQNMAEVTKMSLDIELATFNPALHRFHKIPVLIYTGERQRLDAENQVKEKKEKDGFDSKPTDQENGGLNPGEMVVDEFLSGYYVIGGFKYLYKAGATSVKQEVNLLRREWPSRVNNINKETVAPATTPPPAPAPPVAPPPAPEPPAPTPEPVKEPVLSLDIKWIKDATNYKLGFWLEQPIKISWKADDKSLVTETPKVKIKFKGPSEYGAETSVFMEDKKEGSAWNEKIWNIEATIPKDTFKDKTGKYDIEVILTYKDQEVKETSSWTFREWKPGERFGYPGAVTESNSGKVYQWETVSGEEPGTYIGKYTLSGEAIKRNKGESPMNGKVEGTNGQDVLKQAQAAAEAELMKK